MTWRGGHRPAIDDMGIYPRAQQEPLPIWIGTGGSPESAVRAGLLGLPIAFSILGGEPQRFAPLVELYKTAAVKAGHDPNKLQIATHSHGFISDTTQEAAERYYPVMADKMNRIGRERGWPRYTRDSYDSARSLRGALYVGDPEYVAEKIVLLHKNLGLTRFMMYNDFSSLPHRDLLRTIELLGTKVAPMVRKELARQTSDHNV